MKKAEVLDAVRRKVRSSARPLSVTDIAEKLDISEYRAREAANALTLAGDVSRTKCANQYLFSAPSGGDLVPAEPAAPPEPIPGVDVPFLHLAVYNDHVRIPNSDAGDLLKAMGVAS